jgi:hypothetical protein
MDVHVTILRHVDSLPSNSCVNRRQYNSTTAVAREQLCGHVSLARRKHAIMEVMFSVRSV